MPILDEYQKTHQKYVEQYGTLSVILIQIGTFYEMYEYDSDDDPSATKPEKWGHARAISGLLNMVLTRKNKSEPHSKSNPYLVGFPCISYEKHREILLRNHYTIVRIDQTGKNKTEVDRSVAEIVSSSTDLDSGTHRLVGVYLEATKSSKRLDQLLIQAGIANIEVSTGKNSICEFYSTVIYPLTALNDVYRYLVSTSPTEIIIYTSGIPEDLQKDIAIMLELQRYPLVNWKSTVPKDFSKICYQETVAQKFFQKSIAELDLERLDNGRLIYLLILQYCYDHNPVLLRRLTPPQTTWGLNDNHLILTHNATIQLDLLPTRGRGITSLLQVIDKTMTAMGKRQLRELIVNPITSIPELEQNYEAISTLMEYPDLQGIISTNLKKIPDLEKLHRKVRLDVATATDMSQILRGYINIVDLLGQVLPRDEVKSLGITLSAEDISNFNSNLSWCLSRYNLDLLDQTTESFVYPGVNLRHDGILQSLNTIKDESRVIQDLLNTTLNGQRGKGVEIDGLGFVTTPAKAKLLMKAEIPRLGKLESRAFKTHVIITSDVITRTLSTQLAIQTELQALLEEEIVSLRHHLLAQEFFQPLENLISQLDLLQSHATVASKYGYFRPQLVEDKSSWLSVSGLRHPLVERLIDSPYITNDLTIGPHGILLYGLNSTGKSSLVKAIGLVVIMAQMGMYVPGHLKLSPFSKIITRLSGQDNILKGESSFIVEMSELRTILREADCRSLVLGDELCRGTESVSGASLTIATLKHLIGVSHIFSTHIHDLPRYLTDLVPEKLKIYHLKAIYNPDTEKLELDRRLEVGPGDSLYGLEVARSLHLDSSFIDSALEIRRALLSESSHIVNTKLSKYSSAVYLDKCAMCSQPNDLQTHHQAEQHTADDHGVIHSENSVAPFNKNAKFNLVVLCSSCHQKLHH